MGRKAGKYAANFAPYCGQNCGQNQMRSAHKQKNPTISNVKSLDLWSEWRESNSRPLEPHSSALPKLRYTRISTAASLPKRGDKKYYTQMWLLCQRFFENFDRFFCKSPIFTITRFLMSVCSGAAQAQKGAAAPDRVRRLLCGCRIIGYRSLCSPALPRPASAHHRPHPRSG